MYRIAFVLSCLACAGFGHRVQHLYNHPRDGHISEKQMLVDADPSELFSVLLLALNPTATNHARSTSLAASNFQASRGDVPVMNMFERFGRIVKSNVNEVLSTFEDPEKVMEQAVADMQKDLTKVRQAYAEVSASSKRMEAQAKDANAEAEKWMQRAQLAVSQGEDDLAKEALTRKQQQQEKADSLKEQMAGQQQSISGLYESMKDLESKMAEAKAKKDQIIARARTAKASTKVNDMLAGVGTGSSVAAFERMSEKVEQLEAEADVSKNLALTSGSSGGSTLDQKFKALEAGSSVDDELAAMKRALPGGAEETKALPSAVDDELEAMKKAMGGVADEKEKK